MKKICILGSTGSIGTQTLQVIEEHPDLFEAYVLTANSQADLLIEQARKFQPAAVVIADESKYQYVQDALAAEPIQVYAGADALCQVVQMEPVDVVLTALVGFSGLRPTISAIKAKKPIALANKETLVVAGELITDLCLQNHVPILPVDSEHSAIFQSLMGEQSEIEKIILTASGGPFRNFTKEQLQDVTPAMALKHPNWDMGPKVTIDSSTLVNKGLEVMEAKWLFGVDYDDINVLVHPQSIVHSMVEFCDGAVIGELGLPDMKLPIQYAIFYPDRLPMDTPRADFYDIASLTFEKADMETFEGLSLAFEAARTGGSMPTVFNAANERAVALFLAGKIGFLEIPEIIGKCMSAHKPAENPSVEEILAAEKETYAYIEGLK